jgi:hypothetical protein
MYPVKKPNKAAVSTQKEQRSKASFRDISCARPAETLMSVMNSAEAVTANTIHIVSRFVIR